MADTAEQPPTEVEVEDKEAEEDKSFEELGLEPRLIRALIKKGVDKPTPIQQAAIPLILVSKLQFHSFINYYLFSQPNKMKLMCVCGCYFLGRKGCGYSSAYRFRQNICLPSSYASEALFRFVCFTKETCSHCLHCCSDSRIMSTGTYLLSYSHCKWELILFALLTVVVCFFYRCIMRYYR